MKKYLLLSVMLCMGAYLYAFDTLTFNTVLSKPVGSFWELETTTCAYPDVSGTSGSQFGQVVVNFGPTGLGGTINLSGGPMKVDTLLMEDNSTLSLGTSGTMLFPTTGGKLTVYPGSRGITTDSILMDTLILPRDWVVNVTVSKITKLLWDETKVKNLKANTIGDFVFVPATNFSGNASFSDIPASNAEGTAPSGVAGYLRKN